jgi:hypothetical protein
VVGVQRQRFGHLAGPPAERRRVEVGEVLHQVPLDLVEDLRADRGPVEVGREQRQQ